MPSLCRIIIKFRSPNGHLGTYRYLDRYFSAPVKMSIETNHRPAKSMNDFDSSIEECHCLSGVQGFSSHRSTVASAWHSTVIVAKLDRDIYIYFVVC